MRMKTSKKEMIRRFVAVGLMLTSFAMLFLPWVRTSFRFLGRLFSIPAYVDDAAGYADYFGFDLRGALYDAVDAAGARELLDAAAESGLYDAVNGLMTGRLTPLETARLGELLGRGLGSLRYADTGQAAEIAMYGLAEVGERMASFSGTIRAAMWAMCGLLALSVILVLSGKRFGALPYLIGAAVMLIVFILLIHGFNSGIRSIINSYSYLIDSELVRFGIGIASLLAVRIFRIGPAALVCFFLAAAAFVLMLIRFREKAPALPRAVPAPAVAMGQAAPPVAMGQTAPPVGVWQPAPPVAMGQAAPQRPLPFSAPQPAPGAAGARYCTRCGRELKADAAFCTGCGARIT